MFFKRDCNHDWKIIYESNVLQLDEAEYPLRLCICECTKCKETKHVWIDVNTYALDELNTGKSVLLKWSKVQ